MYRSTDCQSAQPAGPPEPVKLPASKEPPVSMAPGPFMCGPPGWSAPDLPSSSSTVLFMCAP